MARPAIAAGVALALMETLADYGTVSYFGVQTFTTGIYRAWFSLGDRIAAAQLSIVPARLRRRWCWRSSASRAAARASPPPGRRACRRAGIRLGGWRAGAGHRRLRAAAWRSASSSRARSCSGWRSTTATPQFGPRFVDLARNSFVLALDDRRCRLRRSRCCSPMRAGIDPRPATRAGALARRHGLRAARLGDRGRRC